MHEMSFDLAGRRIPVRVRRHARARRLRLRVRGNGEVELTLPPSCGRRQAEAFILDSREWIARQLATIAPLEKPETIELTAIGRIWTVEYRPEAAVGVRESAGHLAVGGPEWRDSLQKWLQRAGRRYLPPQLDAVSREAALPYNRVSIRGQKSRWGSCSAAANINLNYRLLFLEPPLVRYLFIHELCHTVHLNHSADFWGLVAEKEPAYRELDRRLRRAGALVPRWAAPE